jgi:O-antigen/teichoic acid export membrane protein
MATDSPPSAAKFRIPKSEFLILIGLFILPLILFWSVTLGGKTLLPVDNLYQFEPWKTAADQFGAQVPQNQLLSDLILENYAWKHFIVESIAQREIPLWNPHLFAGAPFLANGQHSAYYPFSLLFYVLPLTTAYGWFTVSQLFLAGAFMYALCRVLGIGRLGSTFAAITYQLSGFYVVSVVFSMMIAAAAWLPLLLAMIELIIQQRSIFGRPATLPWVLIGAFGLACEVMAGHIEITYYTLLVMALFAVWRLATMNRRASEHLDLRHSAAQVQVPANRPSPLAPRSSWVTLRRPVIAMMVMVALGLSLSAIQLMPYIEILPQNFRVGSATFDQVRSWAYPPRHVLAMLMPNFFGNPAEHTVFDIFTWHTVPLALNSLGQVNPNGAYSTMWGIKNYVEGGAYVGLLPLLLALMAVLRKGASATRPHKWFFVVLALLSLAFMFGTPLYAVLYYGLPGMNQLHSPFRWVWPFTISIAILAGFGIDALKRDLDQDRAARKMRGPIGWFFLNGPVSLRTCLAGLAFWIGAIIFAGLLLSRFVFPAQSLTVADQLLHSFALADTAFPTAQLFYSHLWRNVLLFTSFLMMSGIVLRVSLCPINVKLKTLTAGDMPVSLRFAAGTGVSSAASTMAIWKPLALVVIALDLFVGAIGFNPSVDPRLLDYTPPVVKFLQQDTSLWRMTTFDPDVCANLYPAQGCKTFNANSPWFFGFQDVRGYDSIILKQYADYMSVIEDQNELQFNRIAPITKYSGLDSPMLDLLNVKYVLTDPQVPIESPKYKLVYDAEVKVYENLGALPRAFVMPTGCEIVTADPLAALRQHDPRTRVIVETPNEAGATDATSSCTYQPAAIVDYRSNDVLVKANTAQPGWLVLADTYFTGWQAFEVHADHSETELPIVRADGNFRAVKIDQGEHTIHFKYSPWSFKLGVFASFMAWVLIVFLLSLWVWRLAYREEKHAVTTTQRVAKNSIAPMLLNLFNRLIDFAFAALMLRILQPANAGNYYFAIVIVGWLEIVMNFGLNTYLTREVARERSNANANRFLLNTSILRMILGGVALPVLIAGLLIGNGVFQLTIDTAITIVILALAQVPSSLSTGITAMFYAYEKAEYPAAISVVTVLLKVMFGVPVLFAGGGIVGLALVSLVVNVITFVILSRLMFQLIIKPKYESDPALRGSMLRESFPLMINHLLATLFFKVDVPMLQAIQGPTVVGWYSTAYKWLDALNIIPAYSTIALFPVMSRQAVEDKDALMRSTRFGIKFLVMVALPLAVATTFLAPFLVLVLGGSAYLPHAATALQIMIWSIPFGWINSITNYILIALGQQSKLTRAFVVGLSFNIIANLILIPRFSYVAAAAVTILSELVEGFVFVIYLERSLGAIRWIQLLWRLFASAGAMLIVMAIAWPLHPILALIAGPMVYLAGLIILRVIGPEERRVLARLRGKDESASQPVEESAASTI